MLCVKTPRASFRTLRDTFPDSCHYITTASEVFRKVGRKVGTTPALNIIHYVFVNASRPGVPPNSSANTGFVYKQRALTRQPLQTSVRSSRLRNLLLECDEMAEKTADEQIAEDIALWTEWRREFPVQPEFRWRAGSTTTTRGLVNNTDNVSRERLFGFAVRPVQSKADPHYRQLPWTSHEGSAWCECNGRPQHANRSNPTVVHGEVCVDYPNKYGQQAALDRLTDVHAFIEQYSLPHLGIEVRDHYIRVFLETEEDENLWVAHNRKQIDGCPIPVYVTKGENRSGVLLDN